MKKGFLFILLACCIAFNAFAETTLTVEDLETQMGYDIDTSDAVVLKAIINAWDTELELELRVYDELIQKCLKRLIDLGESEWVNQFMQIEESDLLSMTFSELVALRNKINLAMWQSYTWQEVTVPQGTWKVGEDIPAGHWTIKCADGASYTRISWGENISDNGEDISFWGRNSQSNTVYNASKYEESDNYLHEYSFEVINGDYIQIEQGSAVFMPYVGKPTFEFK